MATATKMMPFAEHFEARARTKGAEYFARGRVTLHSATATTLWATVRGDSGTYAVGCYVPDDDRECVYSSCTCPYVTDQGFLCKHIWAVLVAARAKGALTGHGGTALNAIRLNEP